MQKILLIIIACSLFTGFKLNNLNLDAANDLVKAATLTDEDAKALGRESIAYMDQKNPIAPADSAHAKRLATLTQKHTNNGAYNFKVYMVNEVNAFATPDGSIRFFTGLMDMMTDDELLSVIGHEIGHVELKHSLASMKKAYALSAARKGVASQDNVAGSLARSGDIGGLTEAVLNSSFSRSEETASDDYSLAFMTKNGYNTQGLVTAFEKLASLGGSNDLLSSHPAADKRADRMRKKIK